MRLNDFAGILPVDQGPTGSIAVAGVSSDSRPGKPGFLFFALHKLLKELADSGVTHASMEASSHGLDQRRLDGVVLAAGAFTNLGRDHMDYHATVEEYHRAKLRLFDTLLPKGAPAVIFADD